MKLEASYTINDLVELVKKDLEAKGFAVVGGPSGEYKHFPALTLAIEQQGKPPTVIEKAEAYLAAQKTPQPAPPPSKLYKELPPIEDKAEEKREKQRQYQREIYARRKAEKQEAVQPEPEPALTISATYDKEFQNRVLAEINELKEQHQPEVVAPTTNPFQVGELLLSKGLSTSSY